MNVNFFWRGEEFNFLEKIVIQSHYKVGHKPVIWLSGKEPNTKYWKEAKKFSNIRDAEDNFLIDDFINSGGNLFTAPSLWRFKFLYDYGGLYCDTDAFALRKFPEDEWIACSAREEPQWLYLGVLKAPAHEKVFQDCIVNVKKKWGNVKVFTDAYQKNFGNINQSHDGYLFYPYTYENWKKLFNKGDIPIDCYSIHFYTAAIKRHSKKPLTHFDENWCSENPKSLLAKLWIWLQDEEGVINIGEFKNELYQQKNKMKLCNLFNLLKKI